VYWARQQAQKLESGGRFPSPKLGTGPGEFATVEELEKAKQAIMWARLRGQVDKESRDSLNLSIICSAYVRLEIPFSSDNWWHSERGMLFVFEEYIKYGRYLAKYLGRSS
jgi:hypothetical protein